MHIIHAAYFEAFNDILKEAGPVQAIEAAAPKAEGMAQKIISTLRNRPVLSAATAAAAGAGVATGLEEAKASKKEDDRRREQVRELLMARLSGA